MAGEIVVLVSCAPGAAESIARPLVEERLAACVNVLAPVTSIYRWQGEVCSEAEELLVIKSHQRLWPALESRVRELHSYDTPEIVCLSIGGGHKPYLDWLNASLAVGDPVSPGEKLS